MFGVADTRSCVVACCPFVVRAHDQAYPAVKYGYTQNLQGDSSQFESRHVTQPGCTLRRAYLCTTLHLDSRACTVVRSKIRAQTDPRTLPAASPALSSLQSTTSSRAFGPKIGPRRLHRAGGRVRLSVGIQKAKRTRAGARNGRDGAPGRGRFEEKERTREGAEESSWHRRSRPPIHFRSPVSEPSIRKELERTQGNKAHDYWKHWKGRWYGK